MPRIVFGHAGSRDGWSLAGCGAEPRIKTGVSILKAPGEIRRGPCIIQCRWGAGSAFEGRFELGHHVFFTAHDLGQPDGTFGFHAKGLFDD